LVYVVKAWARPGTTIIYNVPNLVTTQPIANCPILKVSPLRPREPTASRLSAKLLDEVDQRETPDVAAKRSSVSGDYLTG
jgi:hypothetical protein